MANRSGDLSYAAALTRRVTSAALFVLMVATMAAAIALSLCVWPFRLVELLAGGIIQGPYYAACRARRRLLGRPLFVEHDRALGLCGCARCEERRAA